MRAIEPISSGFAVNPVDGVRVAYEVFGPPDAQRTIVFLPTWLLVHSRVWKAQVPYFAGQGFRVVTYDPRGNGKSGRPATGYQVERFVEDALAVLEETEVTRAAFIGLSWSTRLGTLLAADYPDLVEKLVFLGSGVPLTPPSSTRLDAFLAEPPDREGWNKDTAIHWREDYPDFLDWFTRLVLNEPHTSKAREDSIAWGLETTPEIMIAHQVENVWPDLTARAARISCPTLLLHGEDDELTSVSNSLRLNDTIPDSKLIVFEGSGHNPSARNAVKVNECIHDFLGRDVPKVRHWRRAMARPKRALYVSSPIGLGHVQRDLAIARELRALVPDLRIEWLAQDPVTRVLEANGECIHPMSARLANESAHLELAMTGEHELDIFEAFRDMDEILLANFFNFLDVVRETNYDLWIGDEAWELDFFLHENPELKIAPYVWLTDATSFLPAHPGTATEREIALTADYNAEVIEQVERYPWVRDRALYIGDPDDLLSDPYGPGLPSIREWTLQHYDCVGYTRYFDPQALGDRNALRERFGFRPHEHVAVAAVGGTSAGSSLLRRIADAFPAARTLVPDLRLVVVCGPRIDPATLPAHDGVEYRGYVHNLYEMFTAADVALVQGGLGTTMELVALQRPFLYFPLKGHFEQQRHVAHRLERYGVPTWTRLQYDEATPDCIAERLSRVLAEPVRYRTIEPDGARRAAERIAELLPVGRRGR